MARYYLVDYENVTDGGLAGIEQLNKEDTVFVFLGRNNSRPSVLSLATVEFIQMKKSASEYLDKYLLIYLGSLMARKAKTSEFYIISKDKGYQVACDFNSQITKRKIILQENIMTIEETLQDIVSRHFSEEKMVKQLLVMKESCTNKEEFVAVIEQYCGLSLKGIEKLSKLYK